jgi:hypothetical protein
MQVSKLALKFGLVLATSAVSVSALAVIKSSQKAPGTDTTKPTCIHAVQVNDIRETTAFVREKAPKSGENSAVKGNQGIRGS